jgi:hypothetical protein
VFYVQNPEIENMVVQIVMCESGGNPQAVGDHGLARGICQYHKETFYRHANLAGLREAKWLDSGHQLYLLRWALENGLGYEWACYQKLFKRK